MSTPFLLHLQFSPRSRPLSYYQGLLNYYTKYGPTWPCRRRGGGFVPPLRPCSRQATDRHGDADGGRQDGQRDAKQDGAEDITNIVSFI